ncbi:MAG: hypothetical protein JF597_51675 [Streptomyces sp.]|uniref:hypothetical protein n=1 Tax=Streptomyces sp. TaxID=1931 RepID=UPI0025F1617D|nr:hypothetical protein [Streptomyces sp.]MBW8801703.1 hypothetical protein [Streptomyces sp.]
MSIRQTTTTRTAETTADQPITPDSQAPWSAADDQFFRVVQGAFTTAFVSGAGALLASYDTDQDAS